MIRENDPKLKETKDEVFKDSDFENEDDDDEEFDKKKEKPVTYKDLIREDILMIDKNNESA
jgi:hypothetical protein